MTTYRGFPSTNGPASVSAASGGWLLGVLFSTLGAMSWFDGYWIWNCNNGDTTPRKSALWNIYANQTQQLVPNTTVTSGTLAQGQWNFVPLPVPVQLAPGALYCAAIGWNVTAGIPVSGGQFTSAGTYQSGISNGPLMIWSAQTGLKPFPAATTNYNYGAQLFSNVLGSDPSVAMPNNGGGSDNLWVDVQLDDTAPSGYAGSYRLYPNMADLGNYSLDTANGFTLGTEFSLSVPCGINNIWFYSPATVTPLPNAVGVYRVTDQALVTVNNSPSWSGAAGSGWIKTAVSGNLQAGVNYKVAVSQSTNVIWNAAVANYWSGTGFGANGLTAGPISAPSNASATSPGQESYHQSASLSFPDTNVGPYHYGTDIELTPLTTSVLSGGLVARHPGGLARAYWRGVRGQSFKPGSLVTGGFSARHPAEFTRGLWHAHAGSVFVPPSGAAMAVDLGQAGFRWITGPVSVS